MTQSDTRQRVASLLLRIGLPSVAYFAAQLLAFKFSDSFGLIAAIWPAAGIALASLLLNPRRLWPALLGSLFVVGVAANLTTNRPVFASLGFMIANICETGVSAWLLARWCGAKVSFTRTNEVLALVCAAFVVNATTASIGAGAAWFAMGVGFGSFYRTWWVADALGLLLVTPLIVAWATSWRRLVNTSRVRLVEATGLLAFGCVVAWLAFGQKDASLPVQTHPYLLFAFVVWAAFRLGPQVTVTLLGAISLIAVVCTATGIGRSMVRNHQIPIIAMTANAMKGDREDCPTPRVRAPARTQSARLAHSGTSV